MNKIGCGKKINIMNCPNWICGEDNLFCSSCQEKNHSVPEKSKNSVPELCANCGKTKEEHYEIYHFCDADYNLNGGLDYAKKFIPQIPQKKNHIGKDLQTIGNGMNDGVIINPFGKNQIPQIKANYPSLTQGCNTPSIDGGIREQLSEETEMFGDVDNFTPNVSGFCLKEIEEVKKEIFRLEGDVFDEYDERFDDWRRNLDLKIQELQTLKECQTKFEEFIRLLKKEVENWVSETWVDEKKGIKEFNEIINNLLGGNLI